VCGFWPGTKKGNKTVIEKETFGAMQKMNQFWYETYQTIAQSTFEVQRHSVQYLQSVLTDGVETLKGHAEIARHLMNTAKNPQQQQESMQSFIEGSVEVYMRNVAYLQRTVERGSEAYRGNVEVLYDLTQTLIKKAQEQQSVLWS
jgi:hypothetical protein